MASITQKNIVDEIIKGNGVYEDDSPVVKIVEYTDNWGGTNWGLVYQLDLDAGLSYNRYEDSPHCHDTKVIFERKA
jgi:hypothetical protein